MTSENNLLNQIMNDSSPSNVTIDDDKEDSMKIRKNDDFFVNASMTESYSEILNSPTIETADGPVESNASIVISKRRPSSLNRHHSNQCKLHIHFNINNHIDLIFTCYGYILQRHFHMDQLE